MRSRWSGRVLVGTALILLGGLLLLERTGVLDVEAIWVYLPSVLALAGAWSLVSNRGRRLFWPGTLLLVGIGWQLVTLDVITSETAWSYWPVLVVWLGVSTLTRGWRRRHLGRGRDVIAFGESVVHADIDAGEAVAIFGDTVVDYRSREVSPPVSVDAAAIFGDVQIRVPDEWTVSHEAVAVFGSVTDRRPASPGGAVDLQVEGVAIFGSIVITD
ncbi:MAG: hypothetical protein ABEJ57_03515 [Halobacteriaceae archaeon]